jgi:PAS domain S-box-containing protein
MPNDHNLRTSNKLTTQPGLGSSAAAKYAALRALDQSESKYRRLIEGISGDYVIYTHAPDGTVTYVSPSVENVLGFPPAQVLGLNWRDLIGERFMGRQHADRVRSEVEAGQKFHSFTVEIAHASGSTRLIEIQQRPLFDDEGNYISMEGVAKDITETIRSAEELEKLKEELEQRVIERTIELSQKNEQLRESETRYRNVVEDQAEFIIRWLPGGALTFANSAYCRYYGKTPHEMIGKSFYPTIYEEDLPLLEKHIRSLTIKQSHDTIQHRVYLPDGKVGWTEWTNRALFDSEAQPREYQSVGRDITDLKLAADTIREKESRLARVSRLASMGELVAGIAHEVHQPLHAAKIFAEAARRSLEAGLPEGVSIAIDCTKEISEAISRTAKIIRHLREFTESGPVEFELLNLNVLVQEASEIISYETRRASVKLHFELADRLPNVQGDRVQLEQACVNLLINAYEAMEETPPAQRHLRIRTNYAEGFVRIFIQDVGSGVGLAETARLFDAFYTTKLGGMGMGLSLCKSIAEAHAGHVWTEENKGPGMTFVLSLPEAKQMPSGLSSDSSNNAGFKP